LALSSQYSAQSGTPDCPVRQAGFRRTGRSQENLAAYGYNSPDCPVSQRPPAQRSAAQSVGDAWPPMVGRGHRTVRCAPDSVRCANYHESATVGCARIGRRSRIGHEQWLSSGAPDCPVRHPTKGKNSLPCWPPTAPSCLGAIKGTPRRMEDSPKHTLSIPRLLVLTFTQSFIVLDIGALFKLYTPRACFVC
jgi:hypothetical protein